MPPIPGAVVVTGFLGPSDSGDTYACYDDTYNKGGFRPVANNAGRTGIPAARRKEGMLIYQIDTTDFWTLNGGIADINFQNLGPLAGSGVPGYYGSGVGGPNPGTSPIDPGDIKNNSVQWLWSSIDTNQPAPLDFHWFTQGLVRWYTLDANPLVPFTGVDFGTGLGFLTYFGVTPAGPGTATMNFTCQPAMAANNIGQWFQIQAFGIKANDAADFLATSFEIGWNADGSGASGAESIIYAKHATSNKLWAEVNSLATGGVTFAVDTGITMANGEPPRKMAIVISDTDEATFYVNDVSVAVIDIGTAGFWPNTALDKLWRMTTQYSGATAGTGVQTRYNMPITIGNPIPGA